MKKKGNPPGTPVPSSGELTAKGSEHFKTFKDTEPGTEKSKKFAYDLYIDKVGGHLTNGEIAKKYNLSPRYAARLVNWAAKESASSDVTVSQGMIEGKISNYLKKLEKMLEKTERAGEVDLGEDADPQDILKAAVLSGNATKEMLAIIKEMRGWVKLDGQVTKVLGSGEGEGAKSPVINITMPSINRGKGVENVVSVQDGGDIEKAS